MKNMEDYDVIFLGYPIWWSDMPMAVYTFLESYDFSGKTIIPFCTHEGSGLSSTDIEILLRQIRSSFQPFIIHHPAFDGVVLGDLVYPFTKLYGTLGIDLEAYPCRCLASVKPTHRSILVGCRSCCHRSRKI